MNFRRRFTRRSLRITSIRLFSVCLVFTLVVSAADGDAFTFAILGDRTGETVPGAYEASWKLIDADHPDFVVNVGDSIQGENDETMHSEWSAFEALLQPFHRYTHYFTPGNHDVWSPASAAAYRKHSGRALHYSFDIHQAHFTVLDNSETEELSAGELAFLEGDLKAHARQPVKFVFFHRPSWIVRVLLQNPDFPLHRLAKQYGVQYIVCGHIHQMLRFELEGVTYLSMPSAGGHLRNPKTYEAGWFFGETLVNVNGTSVSMSIKELSAPFGQGRTTTPQAWGAAGLQR